MDISSIKGHNKDKGHIKDNDDTRIRALREKISDEKYLSDAIQRIAMVLSNEITGGESAIRHLKEKKSR